ncbi:hypothetical protein HZB94_04435 [Candidatus Falkowbacteria bacterium]|nr:hypothetical protein [Candidatus Falkowbacteria bacterium]
MSAKRKERKKLPKYVRGIIIPDKNRLILETNQDGLLKAMQILLGQFGFKIESEGISPCG